MSQAFDRSAQQDHSTSVSGSFSPVLDRYRMRSPESDTFYSDTVQRILPFCGNEYDTSDYHSAVEVLNHELNLGLGDIEERAMGLMLHGLAQAHRFDGDIHMAHKVGENSAVHSVHSVILYHELLRRGGLLDEGAQTAEVTTMRLEGSIALLLHDMGESLGEFNSLPQRVTAGDLEEDPLNERKVFETVLRMAFASVVEKSPDKFYHALQEMRDSAGIIGSGGVQAGEVSLEEILTKHEIPALAPEIEAKVQAYLAMYDLPELKDPEQMDRRELFMGYAIKGVEHLQGTRHLVRFCTKDPEQPRETLFNPAGQKWIRGEEATIEGQEFTVPANLFHSARMLGNFGYNESEIGHFMNYAKTPAENALASALREGMLQTQIEFLSIGPKYIDRGASGIDPQMREAMGELGHPGMRYDYRLAQKGQVAAQLRSHQEELEDSVREDAEQGKRDNPNKLYRIETRERLIAAYKNALENGYVQKPGQPIGTLKRLPKKLQPLPAANEA